MWMIDNKWLTKSMIEDIGRTQGIDNEGLTYDEYIKKVQQVLKVPEVIAPKGRDIADLSGNGLKVYLYMSTGRPLEPRAYAEWLGKEHNRGTRKAFQDGIADLKEKGLVE